MGHATTAPDPAGIAPIAPSTANLCVLLSRASHALATQTQAALEELGISARAHHVLASAAEGKRTQSELARIVGLDKTTMVVTMDELEAAGLAERRPSATDRRARVISVTEAGERVIAQGEAIVTRVHEEVLDVLDDEEREVFLDALAKLVDERLNAPTQCRQPLRRPRGK
ncbi:MAG TPA: MarR family winged helix-turn-helix transcriptional regulator [Capillimicrobium sp.]|nr:MarR family winged helix-turn-helix transcriptional regulator [Capillimicrobium sp.]